MTAYSGLFWSGQLSDGESVLIHAVGGCSCAVRLRVDHVHVQCIRSCSACSLPLSTLPLDTCVNGELCLSSGIDAVPATCCSTPVLL